MRGRTWKGPTPNVWFHFCAAGSRSSTMYPIWKKRYSPSGHGCWKSGCASALLSSLFRSLSDTDEHLLHRGGHETALSVVQGAPHEPSVSGDRHRLLGVQEPLVEAHGTVKPERVVQAGRGERRR